MHPLALDTQRGNALYQMESPVITTIARLRVSALPQTGTTAGGDPIYGNTFATYDFDVASSLLGRITYTMQKPRFGGDEQFDGLPIDVQIELLNTDGYLATFQGGYGIRAQDIEQGELRIYASVGVGNPIEMFQGRLIGRPTETRGKTILKARGNIWDAIRNPVTYERFIGMAASSDGDTFTVSSASFNVVGGHYCAFHGLVKWDSNGRPQPAFKQESGSISLTTIDIQTGAKLGIYRIEFRDATNYVITYPSNDTYNGDIRTVLLGDSITIAPWYWVGEDGTDTVITFEVGVAYKGNPIAIAFNLIEKGLLLNYGQSPGQVPSVKIDQPTFTELAQRFESFVVYVDAGNSDNSVWDKKGDKLPLDYAALAQQVLKHVCCTLAITSDGSVTLVSPYIDDTTVYNLTTTDGILVNGVTIEGTKEAVNYMTVNYAHDSRTNTHGATYSDDFRLIPTAKVVEITVTAPFYKFPQSLQEVYWYAATLKRRHFEGRKAQTVLSFSVTPQMGLTLMVGDIVNVVSYEMPVFNAFCEIVNIGMNVGGNVSIQAATVQQTAEGAVATVCVSVIGAVSLW